mmetsp:Transcript_86103/g.224510  ORF Transcript_86103/g.224510 Transcript_86103/m.224510 type:complete len:249 (-) Transcript_86103:22-768(-)
MSKTGDRVLPRLSHQFCASATAHQKNSSNTTAGKTTSRKDEQPKDETTTSASRRDIPQNAGHNQPIGSASPFRIPSPSPTTLACMQARCVRCRRLSIFSARQKASARSSAQRRGRPSSEAPAPSQLSSSLASSAHGKPNVTAADSSPSSDAAPKAVSTPGKTCLKSLRRMSSCQAQGGSVAQPRGSGALPLSAPRASPLTQAAANKAEASTETFISNPISSPSSDGAAKRPCKCVYAPPLRTRACAHV